MYWTNVSYLCNRSRSSLSTWSQRAIMSSSLNQPSLKALSSLSYFHVAFNNAHLHTNHNCPLPIFCLTLWPDWLVPNLWKHSASSAGNCGQAQHWSMCGALWSHQGFAQRYLSLGRSLHTDGDVLQHITLWPCSFCGCKYVRVHAAGQYRCECNFRWIKWVPWVKHVYMYIVTS